MYKNQKNEILWVDFWIHITREVPNSLNCWSLLLLNFSHHRKICYKFRESYRSFCIRHNVMGIKWSLQWGSCRQKNFHLVAKTMKFAMVKHNSPSFDLLLTRKKTLGYTVHGKPIWIVRNYILNEKTKRIGEIDIVKVDIPHLKHVCMDYLKYFKRTTNIFTSNNHLTIKALTLLPE